MSSLHEKRFPYESLEYRKARSKLLYAEIELSRKKEEVSEQLSKLPYFLNILLKLINK
jgi:predicted dithiol-disulfide oxidoreductase (DUF899 family)